MLQSVKVAMPETACSGLAAQAKVPLPEETTRVIIAVDIVTVLPDESWTVTVGCEVKAVLLVAPLAGQ